MEDRLAPATLLGSFFADGVGPQYAGEFGCATAIDGGIAVVGMRSADFGLLTNAGAAYVFDSASGALKATLHSPAPENSGHFGNAVAVSGNIVVVGAPDQDVGASSAGRAYVFNATSGDLLATLVNPSATSNSRFGYSVAIAGNIIAIGTPGATSGGAAYLFDATTYALSITVANPPAVSADEFGTSLGISGNSLIVGAYKNDTGATDSGRAYIFNATTGALAATLSNPTPAASDFFGSAVAISGSTAIVGASGDDTLATDSGRAYLFNATTGSLIATIAKPTVSALDNFGSSVTISSSVAVVGCTGDDTGGSASGRAFVYNATTGAFLRTVSNPTPADNEFFGSSVSISGSTIVVGAHGSDGGVLNAGSASVFKSSDASLIAPLVNPSLPSGDEFGTSVAISSNNVAVIGAPLDDTGATDAGKAYVVNATTGALIVSLTDPNPKASGEFGNAVAISGNLVVVAAHGGGTATAGVAYLFDATTGALLKTLPNPSPNSGDEFGKSVAIDGNIIVVGAWLDDTDGTNAGRAYIFDATTGALTQTLSHPAPVQTGFGIAVAISGNVVVVGDGSSNTGGRAFSFDAATGALLATFLNPTPSANERFGDTVAISGNVVGVGARGDYVGSKQTGQAFTFNATTGELLATIPNPIVSLGDNFGRSVAVSGNTLVVGAASYDANGSSLVGQVYVFDATTGALQSTVPNPTPAVNDQFGWSVALSGNQFVVGAIKDRTQNLDQGAAYLYSTLDVPAPTVTAVTPFVGPTSGGNVVVIIGTDFTNVVSIQFGGIDVATFTVDSASQITTIAPAGASIVDVSVITATGNSSTAGTQNDYTYATPQITAVIINGGAIAARDSFGNAPLLAGQNSVVEQILVTFNMRVKVDDHAFSIASLAGSVAASGLAPSTTDVSVIATPVVGSGSATDGYTQYVLTFEQGAGVNVFNAGATIVHSGIAPAAAPAVVTTLKDGFFALNSTGAKIHAGVADTAADRTDKFWSLFGAVNPGDIVTSPPLGDGNDVVTVGGLVDGIALSEMYAAFGSFANTLGPPNYNSPYDWNLDGIIDGIDLSKMYANFGTIWRF